MQTWTGRRARLRTTQGLRIDLAMGASCLYRIVGTLLLFESTKIPAVGRILYQGLVLTIFTTVAADIPTHKTYRMLYKHKRMRMCRRECCGSKAFDALKVIRQDRQRFNFRVVVIGTPPANHTLALTIISLILCLRDSGLFALRTRKQEKCSCGLGLNGSSEDQVLRRWLILCMCGNGSLVRVDTFESESVVVTGTPYHIDDVMHRAVIRDTLATLRGHGRIRRLWRLRLSTKGATRSACFATGLER